MTYTPTPPSPLTRARPAKIGHLSVANLTLLLLDGLYSREELAEKTGLHYHTVLKYTATMHRVGAVHICEWRENGRGADSIRIFKLGRGRDAKRFKLTTAQRGKRYRDALKLKTQQVALTFTPTPVVKPRPPLGEPRPRLINSPWTNEQINIVRNAVSVRDARQALRAAGYRRSVSSVNDMYYSLTKTETVY